MNYTKLYITDIMKEKGYSQAEAEAYVQGVKDSAAPEMYEALKSFDCNIDFVNDTNSNKDELLRVLTYDLREALAKAEGEDDR